MSKSIDSKKNELPIEVKQIEKEQTAKEAKTEIKKPIRRASLVYNGATYLDDKFKKPGKVYRAVADRPGRIQYMENLGYDIVRDDNFEAGNSSTLAGSKLGSAQTVELGKSKADPGVWMCIDEDLWNERQKLKAGENKELFDQRVIEGQYKGQKTD